MPKRVQAVFRPVAIYDAGVPVLGRIALPFSAPPRPTAPAMLPVRAMVPATPWSFDSWCNARNRAN